ncbi:TlpA family protein disulfide reductase [Pleomorphovibrio marinus]|uniref:TlpA family protein disulfide reductase n=1 Tax=Pleomorphovibrio marinus TaxID=2164132 RepID=UPI000E0C6492|nr:TlpA disulfide reductase family protein [Pleomorphovibrio marinus]
MVKFHVSLLVIFLTLFLKIDNEDIAPFKVISFDEFEEMTKESSDKIKIYNFWATWCAPCIREMPDFEKVNAEDPSVELIFISMDDGRKPERVTNFIEKRGVKSPVFLLDDVDFNSWIDKVSKNWSGAIPATLFVKPNGERAFHEGDMDEESLRNFISQLKQ